MPRKKLSAKDETTVIQFKVTLKSKKQLEKMVEESGSENMSIWLRRQIYMAWKFRDKVRKTMTYGRSK